MQTKFALLFMTAVALNACAESVGHRTQTEPKQAAAEPPRVKDQVLEILCDSGRHNVQEELVSVVQYARQRDGHSDRVWEVADNVDCYELNNTEQA